jgi:transposase-like protein
MEINLSTLAKHFSDESEAYQLVESLRWPNGPICPHCGVVNRAYLVKASRKTTTGKVSDRRVWGCSACRRQFSVLVGTIFHGSHAPLSKWLLAFYMLTASKNGVAAWEIQRTLAVTQKTAWFMMHRIREAMKLSPAAPLLANTTIVADETYMCGNLRVMHAKQRQGNRQKGIMKAAVVTLIDAEKGEARSRVVPNVTGRTLGQVIRENVDPAGSTLQTDSWKGHLPISPEFAKHIAVDHAKGQYVKDGGGTNKAETTSRSSSAQSTGLTTTFPVSICAATWPSSTSGTRPERSPMQSGSPGSWGRLAGDRSSTVQRPPNRNISSGLR